MLLTGIVQGGSKYARTLGFPTLNIPLVEVVLSGVYIGRVWLDERYFDAAVFADEKRGIIEAHLLDFSKEVDALPIEIELAEKIRDRGVFSDEIDLKKAITGDVEKVRAWSAAHPVRVMVFGTFDSIHKGHENMFQQACALAPHVELVVSVARDSAVVRIKKASPRHSEDERTAQLAAHPLVSRAVIGDEVGYMHHIAEAHPDIIALGYDQSGEYVEQLEDSIRKYSLHIHTVRLNPLEPHIYKTSLLSPR